MSPAPGSKASGGAACPVGGGRLPTGHSEDHLGTLCRAGQMRYRPRDLQKHQQDQCEGRGLQRWGGVGSAAEGSARQRALQQTGCATICCCTTMTGTVCVQSAAVSPGRLLSPVRIRSGLRGAWLWASPPLWLDALKLFLGATSETKSSTQKPRFFQSKVEKETPIRIPYLAERRHWVQTQEYIKANDWVTL